MKDRGRVECWGGGGSLGGSKLGGGGCWGGASGGQMFKIVDRNSCLLKTVLANRIQRD